MLSRHLRFVVAFAMGLVGAAALPGADYGLRALVGVDLFSAAYLTLMAHLSSRLTSEELRRHSSEADEGIGVIIMIALAVGALSLGLVYVVLRSDTWRAEEVALAVAGIPLAWAMLQTLFAFHYARLYYAGRDGEGGIRFEGTPEPGVWDFLYFSFTVGMTAQVSDSVVTKAGIRRMVLVHAVLSFFYNTVILALAVNVAASMAG